MRLHPAAIVPLLTCCLLIGQEGKNARYWVKRLELPAEHDLAMEHLVALGPAAVDDLTKSLRDPRANIRLPALHALSLIGKDSQSALDRIYALSEDDPTLSTAAASAADSILGGRGFHLVCDFADGKLLEIRAKGERRVLVDGMPELRGLRLLANGNTLAFAKDGVHEVTPSGKRVWSLPSTSPNDAERLPNGNTLVASAALHRVFEVDPLGATRWEFTDADCDFRPVSCQRLHDGRTLIADYNLESVSSARILEVDEKGEILWSIPWRQPASARRLSRGRTLVVSHRPGRVQIIDHQGKVLSLFEDVGIPSAAQYLPNGHILVGGEGFVRELDAKGQRVWNEPMRWVTGVQRL